MEGDKKNEHRVSKVGRKAEKKQRKNKPDDAGVTDPRIRNPKAFAINNAQRAERRFRRKTDLDTKKQRVPLVDRTPVEPPPYLVAIVGPPKVGKSMQNLIKNWTRQTLSEIKGPITIITGKKRRVTLLECNNDINSMIDVAKVADLVLLIIDASFGFEMEIFEFLNICQVHGFPQIMGVLTHLDLLKNKNQLKKTKKTLKHRFWTEVYPGSKLFYLSGFQPFTSTYPKNEIHNLARFISVMKFRQTAWRSQHAFIVADRMEDLTSAEDVRVNSKVEGEEDEDAESVNQKQARYQEASDLFYSRFRNRSLQKMIYDDVDDFMNLESRANFDIANCNIQEMKNEDVENDEYQNLFVGGDYAETAKTMLDHDNEDDAFGDFEELDNDEQDGDKDNEKGKEAEIDARQNEKREAMKKKLKEKFDMEYDEGGDKTGGKDFYSDWKNEVEEQAKLNRTFFESVENPTLLQDLQGLSPGTYVRIQISSVPYEFVTNFEPQRTSPLIIGSLDTPNQETLGVIQARIKKHRWYPKILKTRDPVILSIGWRRFQTIALYSVHDHNMRNRMIKYTSEHLHCIANFFGPVTPQGTGIIGIAPQGTEGFRITITGTILDMNKSTELVKKLKLIGNPIKIFKKSAFIDGMFNSQLEVTKFIGAKIKCVSGIRGVIKKPLRTPAGAFRATIEDKIVQIDIVFCRTWAKVEIPKFFMSLPTHIIAEPRLVKTVGQLKREQQIQIQPNPDNLYTPIERPEKHFRPLKIPKNLQEKLPYNLKPKVQAKLLAPKRIAVIKEPHERKMAQSLKIMRNAMAEKEAREQQEKAKKGAERSKVIKKLEERQNQRQKVLKKKVFRTLGLINKKKSGSGGAR